MCSQINLEISVLPIHPYHTHMVTKRETLLSRHFSPVLGGPPSSTSSALSRTGAAEAVEEIPGEAPDDAHAGVDDVAELGGRGRRGRGRR